MSSTNKTANLKMHSWVRTDPVVCEDFNENFNKIDDAVGDLKVTRGNCEIYCGTYTGTGTKVHSLTFPKLPVFLVMQTNKSNDLIYQAFVVDGGYFFGRYNTDYYDRLNVSGTTVTITESGSGSSAVLNTSGQTYHYMAFAPAE